MKWDPLIHWMSHVGEGSWASFKRAVMALAALGDDVAFEVRRLRMRLSDLGYAEFFIGGTGRWRTFKPILATSPHLSRRAFLCGGRTPAVVESLRTAASRVGCETILLSVDGLFTSLQVVGRVPELAQATGLQFVPDVDLRLSTRITSVPELLARAPSRIPPRNWTPVSLDLRSLRWVEGVKRNTVVEYTSSYQERVYLVPRRTDMVELPKREAIYAAASLNEIALAQYHPDTRELRVPLVAPLPEPMARAACVAAGRPSVVRNGLLVYEDVPVRLATVLLVGLGHLPPRFHFCHRRNRGPGNRPRQPPRRRR